MGWVKFPAMVAADPANPGVLVQGASGQVFGVGDTTFASPLPVRELSGVPLASIEASPLGLIDEFEADVPDDGGQVVWKSGPYIILLTSYAHVLTVAQDAQETAQQTRTDMDALAEELGDAAAVLPAGGSDGDVLVRSGERQGLWAPPPVGSGGGSTTWEAITDKPATFPAETHTHTVDQVGASSVGRQVMAAADGVAARAAIGAGTGNGTSNLQLGTTATSAAAGNHNHAAQVLEFTPVGALTATNIQDAIVQAAASGGGGGVSDSMQWVWTAGAYPALPATKPAGLKVVCAWGPVQPTTLPAWITSGAVRCVYTYDAGS